VKWFLMALAVGSPCYSATLSGMVQAGEAGTVSDAKIVVFNEMAMLFVQRGKTDRNGRYLFSLSPGSYRIWVLKEGFQPDRAEALIVDRNQKFKLTHNLTSQPSQISATDKMKQLLRGQRNKDPFREISQPALFSALLPEWDNSLGGTFSSHAVQDLSGHSGQRSTVEVAARLNDGLTLESKLTNERRQHSDTMEIEAGLALTWRSMNLEVHGLSIQNPSDHGSGSTRKIRLFGNYNDRFSSHTQLSYTLSDNLSQRQQELHLAQDIAYQVLGNGLSHELRLTGWEMDGGVLDNHVAFRTDWGYLPNLGLRADMDVFTHDGDSTSTTKLWMTGRLDDPRDRFKLSSQIGAMSFEDHTGLVQKHAITADRGNVTVEAEYMEDAAFSSYNAQDVYGAYAPQPLTPFASQSFYHHKDRNAALKLGIMHSSHWASTVTLGREESKASLIHSYLQNYRDRAQHEALTYAYMLSSHRWGSTIELSHSKNTAEDANFDQTGVRYVQAINPFRNRGLGLQLELQMTNNPSLPAWWLLSDMPWDPMENNTWYQGHLSLQF